MDQLHWDTFGHEDDTHSDELFSQAQHLIRKCPCRRYKNSVSRCVRCKLLLAMFAHRPKLEDDSPKGGKSRLEIVSSRASARADHITIRAAPSVELADGIVAGWSDDHAEDSAYGVEHSIYERSWEQRLAQLERQDERRQDELDWLGSQDATPRRNDQDKASEPGDAEDEHADAIWCPNFISPALQLVWGRFTSHHRRIPTRGKHRKSTSSSSHHIWALVWKRDSSSGRPLGEQRRWQYFLQARLLDSAAEREMVWTSFWVMEGGGQVTKHRWL